jgi:prolyl 4-hydroxylase
MIQTTDRVVRVLMSMSLPRLIVFGELLSLEECDHLISIARPRLRRSMTTDSWNGMSEPTEERTSTSTFLDRGQTSVLTRIEERISQLLRWPTEYGEGFEVARYTPGQEFRPHHDYFEPDAPGTSRLLTPGGQRVATLVMYLRCPAAGGATVFPEAKLAIAPQAGSAVFFSYDRPLSSTLTQHAGGPVVAGEKWIATKWLRERALE